jgi:hypothetical protein
MRKTRSKAKALLSLQGREDALDTLYEATLTFVEQYQCGVRVIAESVREGDGAVLRVVWDWEWASVFNQRAIRILDVKQTPFYYPQAPNEDNGALRLLYWYDDAAEHGWKKWHITSLS